MKDFTRLLHHSFAMRKHFSESDCSRLAFLSEDVFDFVTYDTGMGELLASKALEVCRAITERKTFEYIEDQEQYRWYIVMMNMPFFSERTNWGGSIRGAWWDVDQMRGDGAHPVPLKGEFWEDDTQVFSISVTQEEWVRFVQALLAFAEEVPE